MRWLLDLVSDNARLRAELAESRQREALGDLRAEQWHAYFDLALRRLHPQERAELVAEIGDHAAMTRTLGQIRSAPEVGR